MSAPWAVLGVERDGRATFIDVDPTNLAEAVASAQVPGRRAMLMSPREAVAAFKASPSLPSGDGGGRR